jgi:curli biogenesis system outer membrane secretion channel CsgG
MDRLLRGGQLQSMKLALPLRAVEVETEEVVETDGAGGATNQ